MKKITLLCSFLLFSILKAHADECEVMEYAELKDMTIPELKAELSKAQIGIDFYKKLPMSSRDRDFLKDAITCEHQYAKVSRMIARKEAVIK